MNAQKYLEVGTEDNGYLRTYVGTEVRSYGCSSPRKQLLLNTPRIKRKGMAFVGCGPVAIYRVGRIDTEVSI
jgi:hypothetical protein